MPSLDTLSEDDETPSMNQVTGCRNSVEVVVPQKCARAGGAGGKTAVVVGDSVALSWIPAVEVALPGWNVLGMGFSSCPAIPVRFSESTEKCTAAQAAMQQYISDSHADLVITSGAMSSLDRLASGAINEAAAQEWAAGVSQFITQNAPAPVFVLGSPPAGADPAGCATNVSGPKTCLTTVDPKWNAKTDAEQIASAASGGSYVDVHDWFCTANDQCPIMIDGVTLRFDGAHLTYLASLSFGSVLAAALNH
jgi:hypothetical protein